MIAEIYISNLSEDVGAFIDTLHPDKKAYEIAENAYLSDRDILTLSIEIPSIIVLPFQPDPAFLAYYQDLFANKQVDVWVPAQHTGKLCEDLQNDPALWAKLLELGKTETLELKSYSTSLEFLNLIDNLRQQHVNVLTPESPAAAQAWTVNFFGSKGGIRQLTQDLQFANHASQPWMSEGKIFSSYKVAASFAANLYIKNGGVVLKTNKGHAGMGVVIVKPDQLVKNYSDCYTYFVKLFEADDYWSAFPIIVEKYLNIDNSIGGGNPNCEFVVEADGQVKYLYTCGMRVSAEGVFSGVEVNFEILPAEVQALLVMWGEKFGQAYSQAGYRGYFDIDAVTTKDGKTYLAESNVRRTGGTHVYHAALQLLGPNFIHDYFVVSNNTYMIPNPKDFTFSELKATLEPVLYSQQKGEGVVLAAANPLKQHKVSYIIFGKTKAATYSIENEMKKLLS